ncbi:molybdopterin molybdenumtransferase MoeA [bacterium]|nr:MAG: molybdopterin molybdenumtransferase MoeA [bacterium]
MSDALLPERGFDAARLPAPEAAVARFLSLWRPPLRSVEEIPLADGVGRVLARDARAEAAVPRDPRSMMDGYAVRAADLASTPVTLRVTGEIRMGLPPPQPLGRGEAMRIPTGGVLPEGSDAVIPQEETRAAGDAAVEARASVRAGEYVTQPGEDLTRGEVVLGRGRRLRGVDMGLLATLGWERVAVLTRPTVGVLSTGDELVPPASEPGVGQVRDSNRYAIGAVLERMGARALQLPHVRDDERELEHALREALTRCDAVVLTGGSSVGVRDLTPRALEALGEPGVVVHGIKVKPGKPTVFALAGGKPIVGLPGNPTSAVTILLAVARPLIDALCGAAAPVPAPLTARLATAIHGRRDWTWFVPVALVRDGAATVARPLRLRSSHVALLARADGYVRVAPERGELAAGEHVEVYPLP